MLHRTGKAISALTRCVLRQLGLSGHGICASRSSLQDEMPIVSLVMPQRQEWCGGGLKSFLRARHAGTPPSQPDWGIGQVQSRINGRITVNFSEMGKLVIDGSKIALVQVYDQE